MSPEAIWTFVAFDNFEYFVYSQGTCPCMPIIYAAQILAFVLAIV